MFKQVWYINLDKRQDRNKHMVQLLDKTFPNKSIPFNRFSAVNVKQAQFANMISLETLENIGAGKREFHTDIDCWAHASFHTTNCGRI